LSTAFQPGNPTRPLHCPVHPLRYITMNCGQSKIRVCLMIPKLAIGGAEVQVLEFIKHLDRSRFTISLLTLTAGLKEMESEASRYLEAFEVIDFRWRRLPVSFFKMVAWLRRGRFDVLHCHLPLADVVGRPAGWLAGIPVIVTTEHGRNMWKPWYYLAAERMLNRITDLRICVSQDVLEIRRRREGTPASKLVRVPNGVDTKRFRRPGRVRAEVLREQGWQPQDFLVVSVGRLEPEKNYPVLVQAVAGLTARHPGVRCLLVGDGGLEGELTAMVKSLGLDGVVRLAGRRDDIPEILGAADVFVLASSKEGLPVSLLEAMAAGKAVVVTAVGGMPEVIRTNENGLVVPPGDSAALGAAIERLIEDPEARARMGDLASADATRHFEIDRVAGDVAGLYVKMHASKRKQVEAG
jgi:glycosyltransferase involved in cell wall biosynthesis